MSEAHGAADEPDADERAAATVAGGVGDEEGRRTTGGGDEMETGYRVQGTGGGDEMETRSMLYRAVTRAQLMAVVVNELVGQVRLRDTAYRTYLLACLLTYLHTCLLTYLLVGQGWLEFLGHVRLRQDEKFSSDAELNRAEARAAEG